MSETNARGGEIDALPMPSEEILRIIAYYRARLELIDQLILELGDLDPHVQRKIQSDSSTGR